MCARLLIMQLGPGMRDAATSMADELFKLTRTLNGFVWQSKADAAAERLAPWPEQHAAGRVKAPPVIRSAEVYQPG